MSILDDPGSLRRFDASDMLGAVGRLPEQLRLGWGLTRRLTLPLPHRAAGAVTVLGMGGSAIGGDLVRGIFAARLRRPLIIVRDYELPAFCGPETLVVAASFSGSTEETISALESALRRKCPVAVITTGGPLREVATRAELPLLAFPGQGQPRAAAGYSLALLAGLLERAGLLELEEAEINEAVAAGEATVATCRPEVATASNPAKSLAWTLVDRLPIVHASGFLIPVAKRWKTQFNENGKSMACVEELPEATHNAVVGYAQPESLRDHFFVVFLAGPHDHPRNSLRAALAGELLGAAHIAHQVVPLSGERPLAQAVAGIVLGDYVSTYLGILYGLDPTRADAITLIKKRLSTLDPETED